VFLASVGEPLTASIANHAQASLACMRGASISTGSIWLCAASTAASPILVRCTSRVLTE